MSTLLEHVNRAEIPGLLLQNGNRAVISSGLPAKQEPTAQTRRIIFPARCIVGSLGEAALALAEGTEMSAESVYMASLTFLGATCSGKLKLKTRLFKDTRLYTILLADSGSGKKSSALKAAQELFESAVKSSDRPHIIYGVGSGEGLARTLNLNPNTVLCYDELRALMDKAGIESSSLLSLVTTLYESDSWDNVVKSEENSISIRGAHLSLIGCATCDTFQEMFSRDAISIGLPNRLFVTTASPKPRVSLPPMPDERRLAAARARLQAQIAKLPMELSFTKKGAEAWDRWYTSLPQNNNDETRRIDTIGLRMLPLIALITDKSDVDEEVVDCATTVLDYELEVRRLYEPIDQSNRVGAMEQKIQRILRAKGPLTRRQLTQDTNAYRSGGVGDFDRALTNLVKAGAVRFDDRTKLYRWMEEHEA